MQTIIDRLCHRLQEAAKSGEVLNLKYVYAALTTDIMNEYCFSRDLQTVLKRDFGRQSFDNLDGFLEVSLLVGTAHIVRENTSYAIAEYPFAVVDESNVLLAGKQ